MTATVRRAAPGAVFLAGAGLYALAQGVFDADFNLTPAAVGVVAVAAGLVGTRRRVVATGLVLAGWGGAVLLVHHGVIPVARTTPAYMLGIGAGLLAASLAAPAAERERWLASGAVAAIGGPLGLYLSYDFEALGRWPAWALALVALAGWELFWGVNGLPRRKAPHQE